EEQLAAVIAQESAMTGVLEGLAALAGTPLGHDGDPDTAAPEAVVLQAPSDVRAGAADPGTADAPVSGVDDESASTDTATAPAPDAAAPARRRGTTRKTPAAAEAPDAAPAEAATTRRTRAKSSPATPAAKAAGKGTTSPTAQHDTAPAAAATTPKAPARAAAGRTAKKTAKPVTTAGANSSPEPAKPAKAAKAVRKTARTTVAAAGEQPAPARTATTTTKKATATARKTAGQGAPKGSVSRVARSKGAVVPAQAGPVDGPAPAADGQKRRPGGGRRPGLTDAAGVLAVLADASGPLRAREIAGLLGLDTLDSNVNAVRTRLERLAKAGQAQRTGRGLYTAATASGRATG
ncbi:hypothetical protein, partial [Kitasatospora sp. MBT63]|uniref:hypothetical protein n=1 Tax=Kitasatospora sp. MBT63 TaxID=1444768 RepID=UPI0018F7A5C6